MRGAARVALKLYRFEVGAATLAALVVGVSALVVAYRLGATNVPPGCFEALIGVAVSRTDECSATVQAFTTIDREEAGKVLAAMAVLPFALGLLGGVPIVGRELEARTAQIAWSLSGSRWRWLIRQVVPVLILLGVAVSFATLAAGVMQATREPLYRASFNPGLPDLGLHGPLVVARAFGGFGVGLLLGALLGRTLPAMIVGAVVSLGLIVGAGFANDAWLDLQETVVIGDECCAQGVDWQGEVVGMAWLTTGGARLTEAEARARVPAGVPDSDEWLVRQGYKPVLLGVSEEVATGWALYEGLGFSLVGAASLAGAIVVVNRRRPA